ncbi:O-antigen ligase family protein [Caloramator sp. mosi_1]|uniref:O-antigen ligase family protein n=1 Tax=Caloramator sp. mosi_1 TaxID=3023090 RepID=UPI0023627CE0|nr:O-antigen ligase family protein [Caloramator sp. mosi_1]WDC84198.1 O-antigen ligase family protein [Caloramator sp. mosi_1]
MLVTFLYFILGFNLNKTNLIQLLLKWFAIASLFIAIISIIFGNISLVRSYIYFGNSRLRGFMNDPNYFSILQIIAISIFNSYIFKIKKFHKNVAVIILIISILMSGSKTGFIALLIYFQVEFVIKYLKNVKKLIINFSLILIFFIVIYLFPDIINIINLFILDKIPVYERVYVLFNNFNTALTGGGSGRDVAFRNALNIIKMSPLLGIGIGIYSDFADLFLEIG